MINVSVEKHGTENATSLIRRFQKRVQGAGIIRRVKSARYTERLKSKTKRRVSALRRITRKEKTAEMERMGLIKEVVRAPRRG
jgi:ribosomal protein S21